MPWAERENHTAQYCGECGNVCGDNQECRRGECETIVDCPVGQTSCSETCIDLLSDDNNCGSCGNDCGSFDCIAGACTSNCAIGESKCSGSCVDTTSDENKSMSTFSNACTCPKDLQIPFV